MSVLITGGTGMIGAYTAARILQEHGDRVVLYDLNPVMERVKALVPGATVVRGDVLDPFLLAETVQREGVERIVHLAGMLANHVSAAPYKGIKTNVEGVLNVLETARIMRLARVVFASTGMVYDFGSPLTAPMTEDNRIRPNTLYASTKLAGEFLGLNYQAQYGVDFIALRFVRAYGPGYGYAGAAPNAGARLIKEMMEGALATQEVHVVRPSFVQSEWVYVKDLAQAITKACFVGEVRDRVFNIGGGQIRKLDDAIDFIRSLFPQVAFHLETPLEAPADLVPWTQPYDTARAREQLGYVPDYPLEAGLQDYVSELRRISAAS